MWKDTNSKTNIGYIAQELEEVIPGSTYGIEQPDGSKNYQISPSAIIPYITKAIQELSAEVDKLKE